MIQIGERHKETDWIQTGQVHHEKQGTEKVDHPLQPTSRGKWHSMKMMINCTNYDTAVLKSHINKA